MRWSVALLPAALTLVGAVRSQTIEAATLDGETVRGAVQSFEGGVLAVGSGDDVRQLRLDEVESIAFNSSTPRLQSRAGQLWLRSGLSLPVEVLAATDAGFMLRTALSETPVEMPRTFIRAIRFKKPEDAGDYRGFERALDKALATEDILFAYNQNTGAVTRLSVQVLDGDDKRLSVEFRGRGSGVPLERIHGIIFGTDNGVPPSPIERPAVIARLPEGLNLTAQLAAWTPTEIHLRLAEGTLVEMQRDAIRSMDVLSSRVAMLHTMDPSVVDQTPAFDTPRPWLRNATPSGEGLQLGREVHARGLCLIPRTSLTFPLNAGAFDLFEARIGIDNRAAAQAHATFRILLDDEVVLEREGVTRNRPPETIRIPLGQASKLTLQTDFGNNFDFGDHCVFAGARLLKTR